VQRDVARVMQGTASPSILPAWARGIPDRLEAVYQRIRADANEVRRSFGMEPIYSVGVKPVLGSGVRWHVRKGVRINMPEGTYQLVRTFPDGNRIYETDGREIVTRYGGPHLQMEGLTGTLQQAFEAIFGESAQSAQEIPEMVSRFQRRRYGRASQVEDSAYQFEAYIGSMARVTSHLPFLKGIESGLKDMDAQGDWKRAEVTRAWLRAQFANRTDPVSQFIESAANAALFKRDAAASAHEMSRSSAEQMAARIGATGAGQGERFWRVPDGARLIEREDVRVVGTDPSGARLVATAFGSPVEQGRAKLHGPARARKLAGIKKEAREAERKGELPPGMTRAQYAGSLLRAHRQRMADLRAASGERVFSAIRYMQHLSLLGYNLRGALANLAQPLLTLGPEFGYFNARQGWTGAIPQTLRQTGQSATRAQASAVRLLTSALVSRRLMTARDAARWWRRFPVRETGTEGAKQVGALSGEVARLSHDLRGVGEMDTRARTRLKAYADGLKGLGPLAPFSAAEDFTRGAAFLQSVAMARRMGLPSTVAGRVYEMGSPAYYDALIEAGMAIRNPGTAERFAADVNSRTMFDYTRFGRAPIFGSPLGSLFGVLTTFPTQFAGRFVLRPVGAAAKTGLAAAKRAVGIRARRRDGLRRMWPSGPEFLPRGGDRPPATPLERWLQEGGATGHDTHGAAVFARLSLFAGAAISATLATGINFALAGTPGWDMVVLNVLRRLFPDDPNLKAAVAVAQRSAVIDPNRGLPLSPAGQALAKGARGGAEAGRAAGEYARTLIPLKLAIGRYLQNRPDAERLREGGDLYWLAVALGLRTATPSTGVGDEIRGNLGLRPRAEEDERRIRLKGPKAKKPKRTLVGALLGGEPARATA